jgi:internalin A
MPVIKKISALLGVLILSLPDTAVIAGSGQTVNTKSFTQWCQEKLLVPAETRKIIEILLKKAGTKNCLAANSKLRKSNHLELRGNQISDVRPLSSLTNLISLSLDRNQIADVKPLSSLAKLIGLGLDSNQIIDVKPLASLANLNSLSLSDNRIIDVKSLSSFENLDYLFLDKNQITQKICPVKMVLICRF